MKVRYTIDAFLHIAAIQSYINERNPVAAIRVVARIRSSAEQLGELPLIGHEGSAAGTREWVVTGLPYIIVHEIDAANDELIVLAVYHGAQIRPGQDK